MTALTVSAALALAATCAPEVDANLLVGLSLHESGLHPFALHDNADGQAYFPESHASGMRIAAVLMAKGHDNLDVGLAQINRKNWGWLGLTLETALDPCRSLQASQTILTAASRYNTGNPVAGIANGYAGAVTAAARAVKGAAGAGGAARPAALDPPVASIFVRPAAGRELVAVIPPMR